MSLETLVLAANAALALANAQSNIYEYGGAIFQCPTGYDYSAPVTSHSRDSFAVRLTVPADCRLAAIYHTHPGGGDSNGISRADVEVAAKLKVPSYIYVHELRTTLVLNVAGT